MSRYRRSIAAWLAILAVALQVFWPLVAQAQPKSALYGSICSAGGGDHSPAAPGGHGPGRHVKHCPLCSAGGDRAAQAVDSPAHPLFIVAGASFEVPAVLPAASFRSTVVSPAQPRAPPYFS